MTTIDRSFVDGLFWRMLLIGAALALVTGLIIDLRFGLSLVAGTVVGATSLRLTAFIVERMIRGVIDEARRNPLWGAALVLKLFALLFAVFVALVLFNAHAVAFVLGFKTILPALAWQMITNRGQFTERDNADDTESS